MSKKLFSILSGNTYDVRADSEEEALAIFHVSQGNADIDDYPEFDITEEDLESVEFTEADTVAEYIQEF